MDFESLKEQFVERLKTYQGQVEESELYIRLKERYDTLDSKMQKLVKWGFIFFIAYFCYSIPDSYITTANESLERFEENRHLTRELIRAGRISKTIKNPPAAPSDSELNELVEAVLTKEQIIPDQKMGLTNKPDIASKKMVPKSIKQTGVKLSLKKLNLRQMIRVGESLDQIRSSKLINIAVQADTKDPHYFSADYEVAAFDVPRDQVVEDKKSKSSKFKKKRSRFKSKSKKSEKSK